MGCFAVLKSKKKKAEEPMLYPVVQGGNPQECLQPTTLPEPPRNAAMRSLQSAPPSFRTRVKPVQPNKKQPKNNRMRALSAPSSLVAAEDTLSLIDYEEQEEVSKSHVGSKKEYYQPASPQPLPLPSLQNNYSVPLKNLGSFKMGNNASGILNASGPLPLPPAAANPTTIITPSGENLRSFSYEEIAAACFNFSPDHCVSEGLSSVMYRASFGEESSLSKKLEATVTRLHTSNQSLKEFINEVNTLTSLQHPHLCKVLGIHAREGSDCRMVIYERLFHGSLDRMLHGRSDGPPLDWNARMKVALCAAQGLTFLHEEGPFQAMFHEFSTANIQIDKDFSAKLSGYGCISHVAETDISNSNLAMANLSVETVERGLLTPKSNVWSFGIVLLELLTGRKNRDVRHPKEERNLVKWSRPFLADDCRLSLIMDPRLKGRFPSKAARTVADIAQKCLQNDSSVRPTMRTVVEQLKTIQDMKHPSRFPLQEPGSVSGKNMARSPSLNGMVVSPAPRLSFPPSPSATRPYVSPTRPNLLPVASFNLRNCSYSPVTLADFDQQESQKSSSSSTVRRSSVEGF